MTKKLSQYEKLERRHEKDTTDIVKYLRKIIKSVLPYHTTDILVEDLVKTCDKIDQLQVELDDQKEIRETIIRCQRKINDANARCIDKLQAKLDATDNE